MVSGCPLSWKPVVTTMGGPCLPKVGLVMVPQACVQEELAGRDAGDVDEAVAVIDGEDAILKGGVGERAIGRGHAAVIDRWLQVDDEHFEITQRDIADAEAREGSAGVTRVGFAIRAVHWLEVDSHSVGDRTIEHGVGIARIDKHLQMPAARARR